ncbi:MAG: efflux RND transporter periplasmic adaptor subunit, partial [Myxococcota bacterium]
MRAIERTVLLAVTMAGAVHCAAADDSGATPTASVDAEGVDRAPQVETLTLEPREFVERIEVTGRTEALRDATLSAQSAGTVETLVPLGAPARKGQVLARLDPGLLKAAVRSSKANVEAAKASKALALESFQRQKPLYEGKIISALEFRKIRSDLASAEAQLAQAQANLAQAMKSLENTLVVAPFDGVVENRSVKEGEQVAPGVPILRLTDSKVMKVKAGVPERYAADIKAGREASVRFNAYGIEDRSGKLIFVSSVIEPRSRTFEVELELANQDGLLKPEMVARVVVTKTVIDGALVIPVTAVIRDEEGTSVFVVLRNDGVPTAQQRRIELGVVSSG